MQECLAEDDNFDDFCYMLDIDDDKRLHAMIIFYKVWQYILDECE